VRVAGVSEGGWREAGGGAEETETGALTAGERQARVLRADAVAGAPLAVRTGRLGVLERRVAGGLLGGGAGGREQERRRRGDSGAHHGDRVGVGGWGCELVGGGWCWSSVVGVVVVVWAVWWWRTSQLAQASCHKSVQRRGLGLAMCPHTGQIAWRHSLLSDRRCDAGCADSLLAAHVPPPPSGDTGEQRDPKEAAT
jgi:hypothetical protein